MNYINKYFLNESQKRINQEYRLGLKHLFESSVICQMEDPSRKVNEGRVDELIGAIYGGLRGLARGVKRGFGSDVRAVKSGAQALGSGAMAAKKATGNAFLRGMQRFHNVVGGEGFKTDKQVDAGKQAEKEARAKRIGKIRTQLKMRRDSDNFLQHGPKKPTGEGDAATGVVMNRMKQGTFSFN